MRLLLSGIAIMLACSCKSKVDGIKPPVSAVLKNKDYFSEKPLSYYYSYNDSLGRMENLNAGYIDTFSVGGKRFRLFSNPDSVSDLELQVLHQGRWQSNLKVSYGTNGNEAAEDVNGDGYVDFAVSLLRGSQVYLYDTAKKRFHSKPIHIAFEWSKLDNAKGLYAQEYTNGDFWHTSLFLLEGLTQRVLFQADIETKVEPGREIGLLSLYKVTSRDDEPVLISTKELDLLKTNFDYRHFWQSFVRNGYR